jgi:serine/threonine-protein kinase RsbW
MAEVRHLTVRAVYENIPTITHFVGEAAEAAGLDSKSVFRCQMSVDEACTNVVEHAYGETGTGDIDVTCTIEPGTCTIQIVDKGKPFDPSSVPAPKISRDVQEIEPGGIGLHLMRELMDYVAFEFDDSGNRLVMVKSSPPGVVDEGEPVIPTRKEDGGIWVVMPEGRLDTTSASALEDTLKELLGQGYFWLVVDMSGVEYISSRGLKSLVSAWRIAQDSEGDVVLCTMVPQVATIFDTVGFDQVFAIFNTFDEALADIQARQTEG